MTNGKVDKFNKKIIFTCPRKFLLWKKKNKGNHTKYLIIPNWSMKLQVFLIIISESRYFRVNNTAMKITENIIHSFFFYYSQSNYTFSTFQDFRSAFQLSTLINCSLRNEHLWLSTTSVLYRALCFRLLNDAKVITRK